MGKKPLGVITGFPTRVEEVYRGVTAAVGSSTVAATSAAGTRVPRTGEPSLEFDTLKAGGMNVIFHGDNKEVLGTLLLKGFRGMIDLVYIDPPFDSSANYMKSIKLRSGSSRYKIRGGSYTLGEQIQYHDMWCNDAYFQFMYERLILLRELLSERGSIYVHLNNARAHYIKVIMDEIFGEENFQTQIIWKRVTAKGTNMTSYGEEYDAILYYTKNHGNKIWNTAYIPYDKARLDGYFKYVDLPDGSWRRLTREELDDPGSIEGRRFSLVPTVNMNPNRPNLTYKFMGMRRTWKWTEARMKRMEADGLIIQTAEGNLPVKKQYLDERKGLVMNNLWTDIPNSASATRTGYPTEKNEKLVERIIHCSSNPGSLVLDCFAGSGATLAVAERMGRRWIGIDINRGSIGTMTRRLVKAIEGKGDDSGFYVARVNDYDLSAPRLEIIELVKEHLGIEGKPGDPFFDGVFRGTLVKIINFTHPLTTMDLGLIEKELQAHPDEIRDVTVVCLGKELVVDKWINDWNDGHQVNLFNVIELRTDPVHGRLLLHQEPRAVVERETRDDKTVVTVKNFISPAIIRRLKSHDPLDLTCIRDFRAMIDALYVDVAHDGCVFNAVFSDLPAKNNFIEGKYTFEARECGDTVAIKIVDVLGEEVMVYLPRTDPRAG
ncbi:MAG: site-specific DNA-methyltransferase [Promethearchaeota archaeon]